MPFSECIRRLHARARDRPQPVLKRQVEIRRWDDQAKIPELPTRPLDSFAEQIAAAQTAERHRFHSVWTLEFFHQHGLVRLGAVAAATERVQVGTAIAYAFMRTPMLAASAAMDVDEISQGRVILGLGSGTRSMNVKWYSMPFDDPPAPRMREAIELIRAAIDAQKGGGLSYSGQYYQVNIPQYARPGASSKATTYCSALKKPTPMRCALSMPARGSPAARVP